MQHWLWLAHRPQLNHALRLALLTAFGSPEAVYCAQEAQLRQVPGMTERALKALLDKSLDHAEKILRNAERENVNIVPYIDPAYPRRLKKIADAPILFYYRGTLPELDSLPSIGVVGTRHPSQSGLNIARRLGRELSACGSVVVSGLASGIDGEAMRGALEASCPVIGVIGSGIGIVYPKENADLYAQTEQNGCVLSEYPPLQSASRFTFPQRNRIISGLSCGVVIVEAPSKSGALQTADFARKQRKRVFAVPGDPESELAAGSTALLTQGASPALRGWDILKEYVPYFPDKIHRETTPVPPPQTAPKAPEVQKKTIKLQKSIDKRHSKPYIDLSGRNLSPAALSVAAQLAIEPMTLDDLVAALGQPTAAVMTALTALQIQKLVTRQPGGKFGLC